MTTSHARGVKHDVLNDNNVADYLQTYPDFFERNSQLLTTLYVGGASVIMPALDPAALVACLSEERISFLVTVPAVYALLLRRGLLETPEAA